MKKLILLLFIPLVFTCSSDDSSDDNTNPIDDTNPVYLDENGITIKARDWAVVGDSGVINGIAYTIVNASTLSEMIENGDDVSRVCTSRIVNMESLFQYDYDFNQDISSWDVSNVTDMEGMFFEAEAFNQDLSHWDVSNVTNMTWMFIAAESFNQPLNSWDVSNVTNIQWMFFEAETFNQPLDNWSTSHITDMRGLFKAATSFNQDLSGWDVSNVTQCSEFCLNAQSWVLPKPEFSNCGDIGCD